ncbi:MAG: hypothetical protein K6G00_01455 [Treponema sp.]|nr:hypothetical protein [Treponema sp.]
MNNNYDDIINTEWKGSKTHCKMNLTIRAKIFMPFAALKGFEELLKKVENEVNKSNETNNAEILKF